MFSKINLNASGKTYALLNVVLNRNVAHIAIVRLNKTISSILH